MQFLMLVTAAVTPIANEVPTLQSVIGFLIMLLLAVIGFFMGRLYKSVSELYTLLRDLCTDFSHLKGEHDAIMRKKGHKE